jgi:large subunit ribosomal protein L21
VKIGEIEMKYAVLASGGKQYKAVEGATIDVDLLEIETGETITIEEVLLVVDEDKISVGNPSVKNAKITASVVAHIKGPKVTTFKYQPKKRIRVKTGHRQQYTRMKIESIKVE